VPADCGTVSTSRITPLSFLSAPLISGLFGPKPLFMRSTPDSPARLGFLARTRGHL
jgi:hypothetical protein